VKTSRVKVSLPPILGAFDMPRTTSELLVERLIWLRPTQTPKSNLIRYANMASATAIEQEMAGDMNAAQFAMEEFHHVLYLLKMHVKFGVNAW
jgi:hypothetical protein